MSEENITELRQLADGYRNWARRVSDPAKRAALEAFAADIELRLNSEVENRPTTSTRPNASAD